MNTAGILVVYSEAFADTAIRLFAWMVRRVDREAAVVVLSNNQALRLKHYDGVTVLQTSNFLHEFGAWQTGLDHVRGLPGADQLRSVIFANDTFCHYRPMGVLEQAAFLQGAVNGARAATPAACGDLALLPDRAPYTFDGTRMKEWIATYFFAVNRRALEGIGWRMHPPVEDVMRSVPGGLDEDRFFSAELDPRLRQHFCAWLFGSTKIPTWRRSRALDADNHDMMVGKAHMLICEQDLSARLLRCGTKIHSVLHARWIYLIKNLLLRAWP
jgi:hypothetical protein